MLTFLLLLAAVGQTPEEVASDLAKFQGNWVIAAYTVDGKPADAEVLKSLRLNVKGDRSTFAIGKVSDTGTYKLDPSKKPKWIDIIVTSGTEKGVIKLGIYEFAGDELRICHNGKDRPKEFVSKAGTGQVLEVWKRK